MSHIDLAPTRRSLISQAGLLATIAGVGLEASAASAIPREPSSIEAAYNRYVELSMFADATCVPVNEAEERYERPPQPRYNHFWSEGGYDIEFTNPERTQGRSYIKVDDKNVAQLEAKIAEPFDPSQSEPESVEWDRRTHEQRIERAKLTLEKIKEWRAENERRRDAAGLPIAEAAMDEAFGAVDEQVKVLFAMKPTNLRDLAMLAIVASMHEGDEGAQKTVDLLTDLAGVRPYWQSPQQDAA